MPKMNQAKSQQEIKGWEKELKKKFNHPMHRETSSFTKEAIRLFIHHLLQADRKAIREEIRGMKQYHEWASKRDNQMKKEIKKLKIVRMSVWGEEDKELKFKVVQKKINEIIDYLTTLSTKTKQLTLERR